MAEPVTFPNLLGGVPNWGPNESAWLRETLRSAVGQAFLRRLLYLRPEVSDPRDPEVRRIQSDTRAGYEECFGTILHLTESERPSTGTAA